MAGVDLSHEKIRELFYRQIRALSVGKQESFDLQFSDRWLR